MDKMMKALVLTDVGKLELQVRTVPTPGAGEVLVRVKACGICGTDLHIFHGDEGSAKSTLPLVLGHEFSGEVAAVGEGVQGVRIGDRVAVDPNCACGQCYYCRLGKPHYCENMLCYGTIAEGAFAEYCLVKEKVCYLLPDGLDFFAGAMVEPVACCLHGIDLCGIKPGDNILIIGCGPIGQIMVQLARAAGAARIAVLEPVATKREVALRYGAAAAIDPAAERDVAGALRALGFTDINVVIECVGNTKTMRQAIDLASPMATVMLFGLSSPRDEFSINPFNDLFRKEIKLTSSFINPMTCSRSIGLMANGRLSVDGIITDKLPLEKAAEAFTDAAYRKRGKIQVVFE
ncbi:MAG: zinc-dependent alcohol dehydrogenase family protein [Oscillospiraceae bacterium]|nr:zinc-dependent alcohol dehydrogenase family protein [Oscillospiraceae bacterium]